MKRTLIALALAAALASAAAPARAQSETPPPDTGAVLADLILVRPVAAVAAAVGAVLYLPAAWVSSWGGNDPRPIEEALVTKPAAFAFQRPLGEFDYTGFEGAK